MERKLESSVPLVLTFIRESTHFITGRTCEGSILSFRKCDVSYRLDGRELNVDVEQTRFSRMVARVRRRESLSTTQESRGDTNLCPL